MKERRDIFMNAVHAFDSLLLQIFWIELSDLFGSAFARSIVYAYGPNSSLVSLDSEFYLGHYANDAILLQLRPRDESGWARRPFVTLNDAEVSPSFAFSALLGIYGEPLDEDPHRLLVRLLCEVETRVEILIDESMRYKKSEIHDKALIFKNTHFSVFSQIMEEYNMQPNFLPKGWLKQKLLAIAASWWG